jgi:transcriptional regulator with XRE-family HTH domain
MARKSDIVEIFGQRIRELRIAQGLTQEDLAELSDLDRTYVNGIERGKRNVGLRNVGALAIALRVPPTQLFEGIILSETKAEPLVLPPRRRRKIPRNST